MPKERCEADLGPVVGVPQSEGVTGALEFAEDGPGWPVHLPVVGERHHVNRSAERRVLGGGGGAYFPSPGSVVTSPALGGLEFDVVRKGGSIQALDGNVWDGIGGVLLDRGGA